MRFAAALLFSLLSTAALAKDCVVLLHGLARTETTPHLLPILATAVANDPHALDHDRPAGRLLLAAPTLEVRGTTGPPQAPGTVRG